jgi:hypothetical protein
MNEERENFIKKLREIEEQAAQALKELPEGLTCSRVRHIRTLARFMRMQMEGLFVAPLEPISDNDTRLGEQPKRI